MKKNILLLSVAIMCGFFIKARQSNDPKLSAVSTNKQAPGQSAQSTQNKPTPVLAATAPGNNNVQQAGTEKKQTATVTPKMALAADKDGVVIQEKK